MLCTYVTTYLPKTHTHTHTHTHTVCGDPVTLEEEAKAAEADAEQAAPVKPITGPKPKEKKGILKRNLSLASPTSVLSFNIQDRKSSQTEQQLQITMVEYETELRNDYRMIGETGYPGVQLDEEHSYESVV